MNDTTNPFSSPDADAPYQGPGPDENSPLAEYPFDKLKKLYYRSCNVSGLALLLILGVFFIFMLLNLDAGRGRGLNLNNPAGYAIIGILILQIVTIVGLFMRTKWGRLFGILTSTLILIFGVVGIAILQIIVGLFGLTALLTSPQLFGEGRILHKDLKKAFDARKKSKK